MSVTNTYKVELEDELHRLEVNLEEDKFEYCLFDSDVGETYAFKMVNKGDGVFRVEGLVDDDSKQSVLSLWALANGYQDWTEALSKNESVKDLSAANVEIEVFKMYNAVRFMVYWDVDYFELWREFATYKDRAIVELRDTMKDITAPKMVEVDIGEDGKVLWVNIDGVCILRVCSIPQFTLTDRRSREKNYE